MARWVAIFDDQPGMLEIRKQHGAAHLAYLDTQRDRILIAGGLRPESDGAFCGGLWVMEAESRDEAIRLIEQDPYFHPEFRAYKVLLWGKAFENRIVSL
ncbi:MAG: YciI family protein [Proteobacteria bacterium]|nr:YciI family protein [Pseudomonadota bacterium]